MKLQATSEGLSLESDIGSLCIDFIGDRQNYLRPLPKGKNELIAKAIGISKGFLNVVDVTAGLAQDAVVLARLGCRVQAVERSKWVFPLLEDAFNRASGSESPPEWLSRIQFFHSEGESFLKQIAPADRPEVVYLDPMYPHKKTSALPRKEMQIFRAVVGEDLDSEELLATAIKVATQRVVVKRPLGAPPLLEGVAHSFEGKSARYDLYLVTTS